MKSLPTNCPCNVTRLLAIAATVAVIGLPTVSAAEQWELRTAPETVPGTHEIEAGELDRGIKISNVWLPHVARKQKVAVLTNLCIGYLHKQEFTTAAEYCERAVQQPNEKAVAYNNRGVLKVMQGDYEGAMQDFAKASKAGCYGECSDDSTPTIRNRPRSVALRNFERADIKVRSAKQPGEEELSARTE